MSWWDMFHSIIGSFKNDQDADLYGAGNAVFSVCPQCEWESELHHHEEDAQRALTEHMGDEHNG